MTGGRANYRPAGPGRAAPPPPSSNPPSRPAPGPPGYPPPPVHSSNGNLRSAKRTSRRVSSSSDKSPSLPKEGAQRLARQINQAVRNNDEEFMKTPEAGVAGIQRLNSRSKRPAPGAGRPKPKPNPKPKPLLPECRCLYAYDAQDTDELSFNEGDIISLIKEDPQGWWTGRLRGKEGLFPSNYVEKI
ncbi:unconventional myosin-Ie-like [Lingula anatina]|uniref:Unconventional myosin-Ie-like n=1 Tax=Lingula anatina TaxID=7574 RepID=A0A1S3H1S7_LINAN|nr:unconventional myosin-Ie-like [Lingula anatina]|eukprot:XP_013379436.1 unconventional myosin-Ie-like [Lingula anatina]